MLRVLLIEFHSKRGICGEGLITFFIINAGAHEHNFF